MKVIIVEVTRAANSFGAAHLPTISEAYSQIRGIVEKAQASGEFRDTVPAEFAAMAFYGAIEQVLTGWIFGLLDEGEEAYDRAEEDTYKAHEEAEKARGREEKLSRKEQKAREQAEAAARDAERERAEADEAERKAQERARLASGATPPRPALSSVAQTGSDRP